MARLYLSMLAAFLSVLSLLLGASSQKPGFYSVNCGGKAYEDPKTKIKWEADPFNTQNVKELYGIPTMVNSSFKNIASAMRSLRYFPSEKHNKKFCYSHQISEGQAYLLRVSFLYGNYDGLNQPPKFQLILNDDVWTSVNTSSSSTPVVHELTFSSSQSDLNICLASLTLGHAPFISTIEVRKLNITALNSLALLQGYGLMLWRRINYGAKNKAAIRYPDDPYDRIWEANTTGPILSIKASKLGMNEEAELPTKVMATAITTQDPRGNLSFTYDGFGGVGGVRIGMHFQELNETATVQREFILSFPKSTFRLYSIAVPPSITMPLSRHLEYKAASPLPLQLTFFTLPLVVSPLGPLLNAIELFRWTPQPFSTTVTLQSDVDAIKDIQLHFNLTGNGHGDPCMPKGYAWTWITCDIDIPTRIIQINLESFNLTGTIPPSINNLGSLQNISLANNNLSGGIPNLANLVDLVYLSLANNNLSGGIPNLANLSDLVYLDLHNNNLTGKLPSLLASLPKLAKLDVSQNNLCGSSPSFQRGINYTYSGNSRLCQDSSCDCSSSSSSTLERNKKKKKDKKTYIIIIFCLGALYIVLLLLVSSIYMARQRKRAKKESSPSIEKKGADDDEAHPSTTRMFTYKEISDATLNFTVVLGEGGFGKVYHGTLPSTGEAIAVKMLADASKQGLKEFYNEVAILSKVSHKNLVSLIGFCVEKTYMLIYEYVAKGNIRELLYGEMESTDKPLSWKTRLRIALDASQGLSYLHMGCDPAIIHRDVKSTNILLSEKMQAKVADFGLSRLKEGENAPSYVSTLNVMGTVGYLDPAFNATNQLTDKSDVYSFGIVLFELICGRAPIDASYTPPYIVDWASEKMMQGKVEEIVDPMLKGGYKEESMWKVIDMAFECVLNDRTKRPKMSQISQILQKALEVETDPNYLLESSGSSSVSGKKKLSFHNIHDLQVELEPVGIA